MKHWSRTHSKKSYLSALALIIAIASWSQILLGAQTSSVPQTSKDALRHLQSGSFNNGDLEQIAQSKTVEAIPPLENQFNAVDDKERKEKIASVLVRLAVPEPTYWNYLYAQAAEAVESDIPYPEQFDANGRKLHETTTAEFRLWAKSHKMSETSAASLAMFQYPLQLTILAQTGDPRGQALLVQGLYSSNYLIQSISAAGLAQLQEKSAIPIIISDFMQAPQDVKALFADALLSFDDQEAQGSVDKYLQEDYVRAARKNRLDASGHRKKPFD